VARKSTAPNRSRNRPQVTKPAPDPSPDPPPTDPTPPPTVVSKSSGSIGLRVVTLSRQSRRADRFHIATSWCHLLGLRLARRSSTRSIGGALRAARALLLSTRFGPGCHDRASPCPHPIHELVLTEDSQGMCRDASVSSVQGSLRCQLYLAVKLCRNLVLDSSCCGTTASRLEMRDSASSFVRTLAGS
jgi:hypothetical protein